MLLVKINPTLCTPVFFYALPKYLQSKLERVQKRALSIIFPSLSYDEALIMKLVFQPLFHIARTYVTTFLTLPSATGITNLITSY